MTDGMEPEPDLLLDLTRETVEPYDARRMVELHLSLARVDARDRGEVPDLWGATGGSLMRRWRRRRRRHARPV